MFKFTDEQLEVQKMAREFAEKEIAPLAEKVDKEKIYPEENIIKMAELGLLTINIPEEYGGIELDEVSKALAIMEISRKCGATGAIFAVQMLVNDIIKRHGSEAQKEKYLGLVGEGKIGAFCLTEADAGSDASRIRTKAVKTDDGYIITGTKAFISNVGPNAGDYLIILALTNPEEGAKGVTAFLLDRNTEGLSVGKQEDKMGQRGAPVSEIVLNNCKVGEDQILGKVGEGFKIAMEGLDGGRISIASVAYGLGYEALQLAIKYGKERVQFGKPIIKNQGLEWYISDMGTKLEASRLLILNAAGMRDNGDNITKEAAMAKYYATEVASFVADLSLQIHGGYGYMKEYAIERIYRDVRLTRIYEGTSEIQKLVIARQLIK